MEVPTAMYNGDVKAKATFQRYEGIMDPRTVLKTKNTQIEVLGGISRVSCPKNEVKMKIVQQKIIVNIPMYANRIDLLSPIFLFVCFCSKTKKEA